MLLYKLIALLSVSDLKDEKLIKKQTYMETETCEFYSRVFWIFLPNIIKIDPYNFELYCFKVGSLWTHSVQRGVKRWPQFANERVAVTRQVGRVDGDKVVGRFTLLAFTTSQQEHLSHPGTPMLQFLSHHVSHNLILVSHNGTTMSHPPVSMITSASVALRMVLYKFEYLWQRKSKFQKVLSVNSCLSNDLF